MRAIVLILILFLAGCACPTKNTAENAAWATAMGAVHDPVTGVADFAINQGFCGAER
jgi:hypothetical protein